MNTNSDLSNPEVRSSLAKVIAEAESLDDLKRVLESVKGKVDFEQAKASLVLRVYYRMKQMCCLLYTSPSPRDLSTSRMPSSA